MDKNLPRVYASPINKEIHNNDDYYYSARAEKKVVVKENIPKKINEIFASRDHVYKSHVKIMTLNGEIDTILIGKTGNYLLTLSGDKININDVIGIEKI